MARVEEAGRDDRASLADAAASKCRAAADAVRDTLANAHREFTTRATLDEQLVSAATDAFDGRMRTASSPLAPPSTSSWSARRRMPSTGGWRG